MNIQNQILITGGTGTTGSRIAKKLTERGYKPRIASRKNPLGTEIDHVYFDWYDETTHNFALENINKLYLVAPVGVMDPSPIVLPFIDLALKKGVKRIVLLSSSLIDEGGPVFGKIHQAVREKAPEWAVLQPSYFMQNFIGIQHKYSIKANREIVTATQDGKVGFVDADDIAEVGVNALIDDIPHNTNHLITGPEALSYTEAANIIGSVIGESIHHVSISTSILQDKMVEAGMTKDYAGFMVGLDKEIQKGTENRITDTVERITGRQPRSLDEFATIHADFWKQK
ncbi:ergot alkaloid biosynthesis protein [Priestia megaterium]|uniref:ergot alkaloid biosynthesis protein n=1 Tax=Priestia megaterium TaxID=1404 RepID=UPI0025AEFE2C|nr:ergot alkaloid biosynthesis protein [Priestia megaterium]MDN3232652.1 ergot alkaloid biosynthesis protein [Priestia megaterium]